MKKYLKVLMYISLTILLTYGAGRLYYRVTAGFTIGNITSDFTHRKEWEIDPISNDEKNQLKKIFSQKFRYLGKGCQSYVFASDDGAYVLKFVKYQRFRPQVWLDYFEFIPVVNRYRLFKIEKKNKILVGLHSHFGIMHLIDVHALYM